MKVIFKEVGQGDSIIIEWEDDGQRKIGLIDCNKKSDGTNPVLTYLANNTIQSISFAILSHPHLDHFSGYNQLLEYCSQNNIIIDYFWITAFQSPEFLKAGLKGNVAKSEHAKLYMLLSALKKKQLINTIAFITHTSMEIQLGGKWKLKFLYPTDSQFSTYNNAAWKFLNKRESSSTPDANLLSTLIKIYSDTNCILLTSDVIQSVFKKIHRDGNQVLKDKIVLAQLSHHGSKDNFYETFWRLLNYDPQTPIVVSVGENDYGHPCSEAIKILTSHNYRVCVTNNIASAAMRKNVALDLISHKTTGYTYLSKDWIYDTSTNTIV